jgi:hypothetical protein
MVDFPLPETPMTIITAGAENDVFPVRRPAIDIKPCLPVPRHDP